MAAKTFNDVFQDIEKYNPYHGSDGRFTTGTAAVSFSLNRKSRRGRKAIENEKAKHGKPLGGEYGTGNPSDAAAEIRGGKENSLSSFLNPDGSMKEVRRQLHREIIRDILKGKTPPDGKPVFRVMGGGPASGKSTAIKQGLVERMDEKHSIVIDPDAIKEMLPGYAGMARKSDDAAAYFHEESSMIAKQLQEIACRRGVNITYDGTGDGSPNSLQKKLDLARKGGYDVEGVYVTVDTDEAVRRNRKRYEDALKNGKNARLVGEDVVRKTHANVTKISVEKAKEFDHIVLVDNNGGPGEARIIAEGGSGKNLTPVKGEEKAFRAYLDKANE